jgi:hypothetical protein
VSGGDAAPDTAARVVISLMCRLSLG